MTEIIGQNGEKTNFFKSLSFNNVTFLCVDNMLSIAIKYNQYNLILLK